MKKWMTFFILLSSVLFFFELSSVLKGAGNWFFVWINVYIFFLALLGLGMAYYEENQLKRKSQKDKCKSFSAKWPKYTRNAQKHIWGDSRDIDKR